MQLIVLYWRLSKFFVEPPQYPLTLDKIRLQINDVA